MTGLEPWASPVIRSFERALVRSHQGSFSLAKGQVERKVYLPEGKWVSVIDKKVYEGKQWLNVHAELNQYIAFVKEGSEVLAAF